MIFEVIATIYLIIGLALAIYTYMISPCSLIEALLIIFLWPIILLCSIYGKKNKKEDCGC